MCLLIIAAIPRMARPERQSSSHSMAGHNSRPFSVVCGCLRHGTVLQKSTHQRMVDGVCRRIICPAPQLHDIILATQRCPGRSLEKPGFLNCLKLDSACRSKNCLQQSMTRSWFGLQETLYCHFQINQPFIYFLRIDQRLQATFIGCSPKIEWKTLPRGISHT